MGYKGKRRNRNKYILAVVVLLIAAAITFLLTTKFLGALYNFNDNKDTTTTTATTKKAVPDFKKEGVTTYLLAGVDFTNKYSDTIMLVYIDDKLKTMNILQIPHDIYIDTTRKDKRLGAAYESGGAEALSGDVEKAFGIKADHYAVMKMSAISAAVDKIGGVKFNVPFNMYYTDKKQDLRINISKGLQILDGKKSEHLVRFVSRYKYGDADRLKMQLNFMAAFAKQATSVKNIIQIPSLASAVFKDTKTNMTLEQVTSLGYKLLALDMSKVNVFTLPGKKTYYLNKNYFALYPDSAKNIFSKNFNPKTVPLLFNITEITKTKTGAEEGVTLNNAYDKPVKVNRKY